MEQVGFAKVELRQNTGRIDIHIKNCGGKLVEVRPYFFAREVRVPIGVISVKNGAGEGSFKFDCSKLGKTAHDFQNIKGLLIPLGDSEFYFSQWDDEVYSWEELRMPLQENMTGKEDATEQAVALNSADTAEQKENPEKELVQQSVSQTANWEQRIQSLRPKMYPFQGDLTTWAIQVQPRDIRYLPNEHWRLGNNSFVLRGYFNFGSILLGYMEGQKSWFVGVPGIFCNQEKVIASMFGFNKFRGQTGNDEKPGEFGYWYQLLNVV